MRISYIMTLGLWYVVQRLFSEKAAWPKISPMNWKISMTPVPDVELPEDGVYDWIYELPDMACDGTDFGAEWGAVCDGLSHEGDILLTKETATKLYKMRKDIFWMKMSKPKKVHDWETVVVDGAHVTINLKEIDTYKAKYRCKSCGEFQISYARYESPDTLDKRGEIVTKRLECMYCGKRSMEKLADFLKRVL